MVFYWNSSSLGVVVDVVGRVVVGEHLPDEMLANEASVVDDVVREDQLLKVHPDLFLLERLQSLSSVN